MSARYRLPDVGAAPRRSLAFTFDGVRYEGRRGDTLASALLANGVHLVGRSFKYHRPRGILGSWADEPNALVTIHRDAARVTPNLPATQVELYDGLTATSQNRHPSLSFDWMAVNDRLSRFLPAGFYYKTFMWPRRAWTRFFEPRIRAAAGLGVAPALPDPDRYARRFAHCDLLIVGSGPAGLAAAQAAAMCGARIILCDERPDLGGTLLAANGVSIDGRPGAQWCAEVVASLRTMPNVRVLARTTAFGCYPHDLVGLAERIGDHQGAPDADRPRERLWKVRPRRVVLACGAIERPLVFPGNDRPGIMLADAARTYLQRYRVKVGDRVVVVASHDSAYRAALELAEAGIEVAAVIDLRDDVSVPSAVASAGVRVITGGRVLDTAGKLRVTGLIVEANGKRERLDCDTVLMTGGYSPALSLFSQAGGKLSWCDDMGAYLPEGPTAGLTVAGAAQGYLELDDALADGRRAASEMLEQLGFAPSPAAPLAVAAKRRIGNGGAYPLVEAAGAKAFVDWQNDVTAQDLLLATREGFSSIEHIKRYTTVGMATDQGKLSNLNALQIVARATQRDVTDVGTTTFRPPYTPVTLGTLAGHARAMLFDPVRRTPMHDWAVRRGAQFENVGQWQRAHYFPRAGEDMHAAVVRECAAVRSAVGIFDASTLGKIEVTGPDAATFMNRFYINAWTKLGVSRCRYGVLLREDGFVLDDGVVGRIAADCFHVTTTTGGAARVLAMMEDYLQTEWSDLRVWATSTTEQWSVIAVQGPRAREVLAPLVDGLDLSTAAFPHMSVVDGTIGGVPMRLMRVSFTGELGYEVNVPSGHAAAVWERIWEAGQPHGMTAYGTEAMHVLRAEKGFIIVGQETDGTVTAGDAGLTWAIGKAKPDFIGKRSLSLPAMTDAARLQLVGLFTDDGSVVPEEGAQVTFPGDPRPTGHVSSAYYSATLDRSIALAMIEGGRERIGQQVFLPMPERSISATIVNPVFVDPEGVQVNA